MNERMNGDRKNEGRMEKLRESRGREEEGWWRWGWNTAASEQEAEEEGIGRWEKYSILLLITTPVMERDRILCFVVLWYALYCKKDARGCTSWETETGIDTKRHTMQDGRNSTMSRWMQIHPLLQRKHFYMKRGLWRGRYTHWKREKGRRNRNKERMMRWGDDDGHKGLFHLKGGERRSGWSPSGSKRGKKM